MAYQDREDLAYLGMLFQVGASQTNFLNAIGGTNGANTCKSFLFPVSQPYSLASASQPEITEAGSVTGQTPTITQQVRLIIPFKFSNKPMKFHTLDSQR